MNYNILNINNIMTALNILVLLGSILIVYLTWVKYKKERIRLINAGLTAVYLALSALQEIDCSYSSRNVNWRTDQVNDSEWRFNQCLMVYVMNRKLIKEKLLVYYDKVIEELHLVIMYQRLYIDSSKDIRHYNQSMKHLVYLAEVMNDKIGMWGLNFGKRLQAAEYNSNECGATKPALSARDE